MKDATLLTTRQLAERWGRSVSNLANLRSLGRSPIPYVKLGEAVRYRLADVLAYEAARTVPTRTAA